MVCACVWRGHIYWLESSGLFVASCTEPTSSIPGSQQLVGFFVAQGVYFSKVIPCLLHPRIPLTPVPTCISIRHPPPKPIITPCYITGVAPIRLTLKTLKLNWPCQTLTIANGLVLLPTVNPINFTSVLTQAQHRLRMRPQPALQTRPRTQYLPT